MENLTTTTTTTTTTTIISKSKNKLFKLLQKAIRNLPRKNKKTENSSGQCPPVVETAAEGGQMIKSSSFGDPTSPKISCIGQIKHKKNLAKNIHLFLHKEMCPATASRNMGSLMKPTFFLPEVEKIPSNMRNNGVSKQMGGRKSSCSLSEKAPCFDQMKRFASCHGGELSDFDWKIAQIDAEDYMNDEWKCNYSDSEEDEEVEKIHFSAPLIGVGGRYDHVQELEPRKEVNLWRRRTIDQLTPLQIRPNCTSLTVHRSRWK